MNNKESMFKKTLLPVEFRDVKVINSERINDNFMRLTLEGESLKSFQSPSFDDHVKIIFTNENEETVRRNYTPRFYDSETGRLTIDFVMHQDGQASRWAENVKCGEELIIAGPRLSVEISNDLPWQILIGDATALPAINRRLETLSTNSHVDVFLLDIKMLSQLMKCNAFVTVHVSANDEEFKHQIVNFDLPQGNGLVWAAGEHKLMTWLKDHVHKAKSHPKTATRITSYWRTGTDSFHEEHSEHITQKS
ncbi:siderophore-interacting protein [Pseudoalteromonas sp. 2CM39R]|uniref:siderophore-interacting protein n=1 Tax=Pseudoalteromonas sp. 2CM39R TaxID=2929856 RepID=UPI0020BD8F12|nr:siderophore-interacting protein [Pseudoalteromonas sp. 2CM39R]MCK8123877.1 siderophore-interacting protein [Pseudoalteromonas sp. 2CM39R]